MKNLITVFSLLIVTSFCTSAQQRECLTVPVDSMRRANNPRLGTTESIESWVATNMRASGSRIHSNIYRIPVVVHIVHNGESVGEGANISFAQIQSQIEVLNEDFRRLEGTNGFNDDPNGADTGIEFYLAENDPDGNELSEPGVDRVYGGRAIWPTGVSQSIENQLKPTTIWDPERYFNVWTVNFGGFIGRNLLGYAQFPDMSGLAGLDENEGSALTDGIVVGYQYFGSSEKGDFSELRSPFDLGRTATHEVGHWLGLRHIWGDGDCLVDDFVSDTPRSSEPTNGCPSEDFVTCTEPMMYENFMDYSNDGCMNIFTQGQKERMIAVLENAPRRPSNLEQVVLHAVANELPILTVYPNPFSSNIKMDTQKLSQYTNVEIYNANGHLILSQDLQFEDGTTESIELPYMHKGIYFLTLIGDNSEEIQTVKIIKK